MDMNMETPNINDTQLERDIENAIRARGLREAMQQWEQEQQQTTTAPISTAPTLKPKKQKIRPIWSVVISFSAAAAVLVLVFISLPQGMKRNAERWAYREYAKYFKHSTPRPKTDIAPPETFYALAAPTVEYLGEKYESNAPRGVNSQMLEAVMEMQYGRYATALLILQGIDEEADKVSHEDIVFLTAICEASSGNIKKTKNALSQLAAESETYGSIAAQMLSMLK